MYILENIFDGKKIIAKIFRYKQKKISGIKFLTKKSLSLQVGVMSHPAKHFIVPHYHLKTKKINKTMSEFLFILSGKVKVKFYKKNKKIIKTKIINKKDMILLIEGGHGFEMIKKTEMIEVKQGPFSSDKDKIRF